MRLDDMHVERTQIEKKTNNKKQNVYTQLKKHLQTQVLLIGESEHQHVMKQFILLVIDRKPKR
jgi:hypothetical protein